MRNKYFSIIGVILLLLSCSDQEMDLVVNVHPDAKDSIDYNYSLVNENSKWTKFDFPNELSAGTIQGAAYYNGNIYQFRYDNSISLITVNYDIYNLESNSWTKGEKSIKCLPYGHVGSACFFPEVVDSYTYGENLYNCTVPFVFLTGHYNLGVFNKSIKYEVIDVVDIENDNLIRRYTFPSKLDDEIAAYDFEHNKLWIIGYNNDVLAMSPYVIDEYDVDLSSLHPDKTNFTSEDVVSSYTVGGPNRLGYQETLVSGTLQDADYNNGYIYIVVGRGSNSFRTEWTKIHAYDVNSHHIVHTLVSPDCQEAQGLARVGDDLYITTVAKNLWKLSENEGYDNKYNFEPATEIATDSFEISNASQLVWFKSQVYGGRCYIKGTLTADIDMSQVEDPYTFYVYDTNITDGKGTDGRIYEAHYAFRGLFDGQGHTISNFNIESTPFYNDGLFPYVVDATIKNLTINGNIRLTKAERGSADDFEIRNVGFIGYMNGGTLDNIDVQGITIDASGVLNSKNINKLVGSENGTITKKNIKQ